MVIALFVFIQDLTYLRMRWYLPEHRLVEGRLRARYSELGRLLTGQ